MNSELKNGGSCCPFLEQTPGQGLGKPLVRASHEYPMLKNNTDSPLRGKEEHRKSNRNCLTQWIISLWNPLPGGNNTIEAKDSEEFKKGAGH